MSPRMQGTSPATRPIEHAMIVCPIHHRQLCLVCLSAVLFSASNTFSSRYLTQIQLGPVADAAHLNWLRNQTATNATLAVIIFANYVMFLPRLVSLSVSRLVEITDKFLKFLKKVGPGTVTLKSTQLIDFRGLSESESKDSFSLSVTLGRCSVCMRNYAMTGHYCSGGNHARKSQYGITADISMHA